MLKKKYDKSDMKKSMQKQYGKEEGKKVYFATHSQTKQWTSTNSRYWAKNYSMARQHQTGGVPVPSRSYETRCCKSFKYC